MRPSSQKAIAVRTLACSRSDDMRDLYNDHEEEAAPGMGSIWRHSAMHEVMYAGGSKEANIDKTA